MFGTLQMNRSPAFTGFSAAASNLLGWLYCGCVKFGSISAMARATVRQPSTTCRQDRFRLKDSKRRRSWTLTFATLVLSSSYSSLMIIPMNVLPTSACPVLHSSYPSFPNHSL
ncbi:hypothetical protein N657DRAFT_443513 [Parathielavia appendiculata]|uniref:Uncharacterized protein n=1 Tax=Parathielavia appendiculata TaxID=2587402 RepID=A0AAN6TYB8_9PEZI|nr:hypothetical protein N657DRAFT_443513 [Parathielavia appendiculata]